MKKKKSFPTLKAEALDRCQFELKFIPYGRQYMKNGVYTVMHCAPVPNGTLFKFITYQELDEESLEIIDVSYQIVPDVRVCDCPKDDSRIFLFKGDSEYFDHLLEVGDAVYMEVEDATDDEVADSAPITSMTEDELDEELAELDDEDDRIFEESPADEEYDDEADEEIGEDESSDDVDEEEGVEIGDLTPEEIRQRLSQRNRFSDDDDDEIQSVEVVEEYDEDEEYTEDAEDTDDAGSGEEEGPETEDSEEDNGEDEEESSGSSDTIETKEPDTNKGAIERQDKPQGKFIGAPESHSSYKEPYRNKKNKHGKKRRWDDEDDFASKNSNNRKKDKKKAKRDNVAETSNGIDFSAIVSNAFSKN